MVMGVKKISLYGFDLVVCYYVPVLDVLESNKFMVSFPFLYIVFIWNFGFCALNMQVYTFSFQVYSEVVQSPIEVIY